MAVEIRARWGSSRPRPKSETKAAWTGIRVVVAAAAATVAAAVVAAAAAVVVPR